MKSDKTSTSTSKKAEKSVAPKSEPVKRTTKSSTAAKTPVDPPVSSHKHSKAVAPVTQAAGPVATTMPAAAAPAKVLDYDAVSRLAHSFWVERNHEHGFAEEDWHRAVKVLSASV